MSSPGWVIAATGLAAEARYAERSPNVTAVCGGGDTVRLATLLDAALAVRPLGLISFGIAGGLQPGLRVGRYVVGLSVRDGERTYPADQVWSDRLSAALPSATRGIIAGSSTAVADIGAKAALHKVTGALAVDMESHVVARIANDHKLPFAVLRVVADRADHVLPPAAIVGLRPDGTPNVGAVLRSMAQQPGQFADLVRVAIASRQAMAALFRCHRLLGPGLGFTDLG